MLDFQTDIGQCGDTDMTRRTLVGGLATTPDIKTESHKTPYRLPLALRLIRR